MRIVVLMGLLLVAGCDDEPVAGAELGMSDASVVDMGPMDHDLGVDHVALDEGVVDAGTDAGPEDLGPGDVGVDTGPTCECSSGPCCDGCHFRPATHVCEAERVTAASCGAAQHPTPACQSGKYYAYRTVADVYCSGSSSACDGSTGAPEDVAEACINNTACFPQYPDLIGFCTPCP